MTHTAKSLARLKAAVRAAAAQVFLGWALKMDAAEVMDTVVGGIRDGERLAGRPYGSWEKCRTGSNK